MFSIFKKKKDISIQVGELLLQDMHSHILPGIDDGSPDVATSVKLLQDMMAIGYQRFIFTPHIMAELHINNQKTISNAFSQLKEKVDDLGINVPMRYAAEYMIDENFVHLLQQGDMLTLYDNVILIETPYYSEPLDIEEVLFQIELSGYSAILAHPERYHYLDDQLSQLEKYKKRGFDLQLNLLSLIGHYGPREKEISEKILSAGMADYLGSDLHHDKHMSMLKTFTVSEDVMNLIQNTNWKNSIIRLEPHH